MSNWYDVQVGAPDLAEKVQARFTANKHHVMATLRVDGSPRVSGTEVVVTDDDLLVGSMWHARKALDLLRDPRVAIHSNPGDDTMTGGDAKLDAVAVEVPDDHPVKVALQGDLPPEPFHVFRLELRRVVLTEVDHEANALFVHQWEPGQGVRTTKVE